MKKKLDTIYDCMRVLKKKYEDFGLYLRAQVRVSPRQPFWEGTMKEDLRYTYQEYTGFAIKIATEKDSYSR